jgi:hypothetical protein
MVAFKVLIFALSAILAAPAQDSADYFVNGVFNPNRFGTNGNGQPSLRS